MTVSGGKWEEIWIQTNILGPQSIGNELMLLLNSLADLKRYCAILIILLIFLIHDIH